MLEQSALMSHFTDVSDPRRDQGKSHLLSDMLALTICAHPTCFGVQCSGQCVRSGVNIQLVSWAILCITIVNTPE